MSSAFFPRRYAAPSSWNQAAIDDVAPKDSPSPTRPSAVSISTHIAFGTRSNVNVRSATMVESTVPNSELLRNETEFGGVDRGSRETARVPDDEHAVRAQ